MRRYMASVECADVTSEVVFRLIGVIDAEKADFKIYGATNGRSVFEGLVCESQPLEVIYETPSMQPLKGEKL